MNTRTQNLIIALIFSLVLAGWWLHNSLPNHAWAIYTLKEGWNIEARGWDILIHLWPIAFTGLFIGILATTLIGVPLYCLANNADHKQEIANFKKQLEDEKERANNADKNALYALKNKHTVLIQREGKAQKLEEKANNTINQAIASVAKAKKDQEAAVMQAEIQAAKAKFEAMQKVLSAEEKLIAAEKETRNQITKKDRASQALGNFKRNEKAKKEKLEAKIKTLEARIEKLTKQEKDVIPDDILDLF